MRASGIAIFWQEHRLALADEEGFRFGSQEVALTGALVSWIASTEAVQAAAEYGCNLMIVHEDLLYPPAYTTYRAEDYLSGRVNARRLSLLARHGITVFRAHESLDTFCILDDFTQTLGLPEPSVGEGFYRVYDIPATPVRALAAQARDRLGLPHIPVRFHPTKRPWSLLEGDSGDVR